MIDKDKLLKQGYSLRQINQIIQDETLTALPTQISANALQLLRTLHSDDEIDTLRWDWFVDFFRLLEEKHPTILDIENKADFFDFINECDKSSIKNFILLVEQSTRPIDLKKAICISKKDYLNENDLYKAYKYYLDNDIDVSFIYSIHNEVIINMILDKLSKDKSFPVNLFENRDAKTSELLLEIFRLQYNKYKIDEGLLKQVDSPRKYIMANYLKEIDKNYNNIISEKNNDKLDALFNIYNRSTKDFLKLYNKKYSIYKLNLIAECIQCNLDYDFIIGSKNSKGALTLANDFYVELVPKDVIKYILQHFDEYTKEDIRLFDRYSYSLHTSNETLIAKTPSIFDVSFDTNQRAKILRGFKIGIDLTKYCDNRFMPSQMEVILNTLRSGMPIDNLLNPELTPSQMEKVAFYNMQGIEFDNIKDYEKDYIKDSSNYYNDFLNKCRVIFNGVFPDTYMLAMLNELVIYNNTHEYKFNIEKVLLLAPYFKRADPKTFSEFLSLGEKTESLLEDISDFNGFGIKLQALLYENDYNNKNDGYTEFYLLDKDYDLLSQPYGPNYHFVYLEDDDENR